MGLLAHVLCVVFLFVVRFWFFWFCMVAFGTKVSEKFRFEGRGRGFKGQRGGREFEKNYINSCHIYSLML